MAEPNNDALNQGQDNNPTAGQQPGNTPNTAVNVDINSVILQAEAKATEAAEKKMEAVFKSMLTQQGLDADSINKMTTEWKSKQVTPEQTIQELNAKLETEQAKYRDLQQTTALNAANIPQKEQSYYREKINAYAKEKGIDFANAVTAYLETDPVTAATGESNNPKPPAGALYGGRVGDKQQNTVDIIEQYKQMSTKEKFELKQNNPTLWSQIKSKLGLT